MLSGVRRCIEHNISCCLPSRVVLPIFSRLHTPFCLLHVYPFPALQVAMEKGLSPQQAAQALTEEALSAHSVTPATRDNITGEWGVC